MKFLELMNIIVVSCTLLHIGYIMSCPVILVAVIKVGTLRSRSFESEAKFGHFGRGHYGPGHFGRGHFCLYFSH